MFRALTLSIACAVACLAGSPAVGDHWPTVKPEDAGFDPAKLELLRQSLATRKTTAFLVIRHGKVVCEWYAPGFGPEHRNGTASLAKAIVGGVSLLAAMDAGRISPDDLASQYILAWRDDHLKSVITIRHLVTHTSGVEDAEQDAVPHERLPGWKGAFWRRLPGPFSIALNQALALFIPGERYQYSNPGMAALAYAVTASLRGTPRTDILDLLGVRILRPLGVPGCHPGAHTLSPF